MEPTQPVEQLTHLDIQPARQSDGTIRVVVVDQRCGLQLLTLTPQDAARLGGLLVARSARAGWTAGRAPTEPAPIPGLRPVGPAYIPPEQRDDEQDPQPHEPGW